MPGGAGEKGDLGPPGVPGVPGEEKLCHVPKKLDQSFNFFLFLSLKKKPKKNNQAKTTATTKLGEC